MLCQIGGCLKGKGGARDGGRHSGCVVLVVVLVVLHVVGDGAEGRRQGGGVDGGAGLRVGGGRHEQLVKRRLGGVHVDAVAVVGAEELLREGDGVDGRAAAHALQFLEEQQVGALHLEQLGLELHVADLERLDLEPLALARRLGGAAVPEHALDAALLLLVFRLGALSAAGQR